jgi:hypothetical protein
MPESLLKSQFAALEEPDLPEALIIDITKPIANEVDSIVAGLALANRKDPNQTENCHNAHKRSGHGKNI